MAISEQPLHCSARHPTVPHVHLSCSTLRKPISADSYGGVLNVGLMGSRGDIVQIEKELMLLCRWESLIVKLHSAPVQ